ncbi:MAG: hypothetical protein JNN08_05455 [Bryobacterales bacterium]|nr:hypothetical protein [Bryobacterales bacterium]
MPPARTGVADYSAALVRALRDAGVNVAVNPTRPCDREVYHIGNNPTHAAIYARALDRPGVVVLHDALLHHFFLGRGSEQHYVEEFVYNYGAWTRGLAHELWRGRARSGHDPLYFDYPMLRRLMERSRVVVVHNPAAAATAKAHHAARIVEIPHILEPIPEPPGYAVDCLRAQWALPPAACVFGIFGHLRESKRVHTVLNAFERLAAQDSVRLLVAGDCVSSDLARALDARLRHPHVLRKPYLSESGFWLHAAAVDVCINLRYPSAGETSGIGIRLMGLGKPIIVTAGPEVSRFPTNTVIPIDAGLAEEEMLLCAMHTLATSPIAARRLGHAARNFMTTHHSPQLAVQGLLSALVDYN